LKVDVPGYSLELSGMAEGGSLLIEEESGKVSVRFVEDSEVQQPSTEGQEVSQAAGQDEVQTGGQDAPQGASVVEAVSKDASRSLFSKLVALRKQIAAEAGLPPFIIFHDSTLRQMCSSLPADLEAMKGIQGVGASKLEKYGKRFLEAIREYVASQGKKEAA
jgi:ATP-dependent DNA helicase RecQ